MLLECVAVHPYKGQYEDELSFMAGDKVEVTADSKGRGWGMASRLGWGVASSLGTRVKVTADSKGRGWGVASGLGRLLLIAGGEAGAAGARSLPTAKECLQ